jgi:transcriptional regulator with XRE-family HTH domain
MKGFNSIFQKRLNELLELEKITDAALKTGLKVDTLYAYFYGKAMPRAERLGRIAAGYGVSADWLAGRVGDRREAVRRLPDAGCRAIFTERLNSLIGGRSGREIAAGSGFSEHVIWNYRKGKMGPGLYALIDMADFFDVSIDYLIGLEAGENG